MRLELSVPAELDRAREKRLPLIIPVGVIEYHSGHLPVGTDALVAIEFAKRLEQNCELVLAPPIWYGPASYAVGGPEGYTIDMDSMIFNQTLYHIYMSMLRSGWRNIYTLIAHQTETFNPTETACLDASRRVLFRFLEDTRGIGWWGKPSCQDFYSTMDQDDNPWNWIKVRPLAPRGKGYSGDHAGIHETSMLWALAPENIRVGQIGKSGDWFTQSAADASQELGEQTVRSLLKDWLEELRIP